VLGSAPPRLSAERKEDNVGRTGSNKGGRRYELKHFPLAPGDLLPRKVKVDWPMSAHSKGTPLKPLPTPTLPAKRSSERGYMVFWLYALSGTSVGRWAADQAAHLRFATATFAGGSNSTAICGEPALWASQAAFQARQREGRPAIPH